MSSGRAYDMGIVMTGYPYMVDVGWNIMNFGPLYIPKAGDTIKLDRMAYVLYRQVIEWQQKQKLRIEGDETGVIVNIPRPSMNSTITMRCEIYNGTTHVCTAVLPLTVHLNFP